MARWCPGEAFRRIDTSMDIRVNLLTQDGEKHSVDVPQDIRTADFLKEVVDGLNLETEDAQHNRIVWVLHHKETAVDLRDEGRLDEAGVREGHHLYLRRVITAGNRSARNARS
jgi:hypothetical protein